jgi:peroxiredoxin
LTDTAPLAPGDKAPLSDPDRKVLTAWGAYGEKPMYSKTVKGVHRRLTHT